MVFQVYNKERENVLLDIELYMKKAENTLSLWYSEISVYPIVKEIVDFVVNNNYDWKEFANDFDEIQHLRRWLHESNINSIEIHDIANQRHYGEIYNKVREMVFNFANKYNLNVNLD